jgi:AcrR family transcriptional regulator
MSSNLQLRRGEVQGWRGEPLPRGRHKLAPDDVRASQRERLVRAMVETVAERSYEATTVPDVVARARVSRNAFYEFFEDKTDCFIAACDAAAADMLDALLSLVSERDWVQALRCGMRDYLAWWSERPAFARAYFIGLPSAGERAITQRDRQYTFFRAMFADLGRRARAEQPDLPPLSELVPRVLVLSITELVAEEVRRGRTDRLNELGPELAVLAIRLLADDETARRAA